MKKLLKINAWFVICFLIIAICPLVAKASSPSITFSPSSGSHEVLVPFEISVVASGGGSDMTMASAVISSSNLTIEDVTLSAGVSCPAVAPKNSSLSFTGCNKSNATAFSGFTIYTIRVHGTVAGTASLSLSNGKIVNSDGTAFLTESASASASYTITAPVAAAPTPTVAAATTTEPTPVATIAAPTCRITANPTSVTVGGNTTLTWSTARATSVSATWTTLKKTSGTQSVIVATAGSNTYRMNVTGAGGTGNCTVAVTATAAAAAAPVVAAPAEVAPTMPTEEDPLGAAWDEYSTSNGSTIGVSTGAVTVVNSVDSTFTGVIFSGTTTPGALVTVYVYSAVQTIGSTTANATTGAWTVTINDPLAAGSHTAYAISTKSGTTTRIGQDKLSFILNASAKTATKVSNATNVNSNVNVAPKTTATTKTTTSASNSTLLIAIGLIVILIIIFIAAKRKRRSRR